MTILSPKLLIIGGSALTGTSGIIVISSLVSKGSEKKAEERLQNKIAAEENTSSTQAETSVSSSSSSEATPQSPTESGSSGEDSQKASKSTSSSGGSWWSWIWGS